MDIIIGYTLKKPILTQKECDSYAAMAQAVNEHNATCGDADTKWRIEDSEDSYTVSAVPPPTAEELAAQEKAKKEAEEKAQLPTAEERLAALEAAMLDLLAAQA